MNTPVGVIRTNMNCRICDKDNKMKKKITKE